MCGIVALFAATPEAAPPTGQELLAVREHMASRGPDGSGSWISPDGRVALGHRRLAIIDLSPGGAQPMLSADGASAIVFNGEIYNHRELRADLERRGYRFRSQSDTEVLLAAYLADGPAMLPRLRGMFAFAIWDGRERKLFLARDPYGIKPLYYSFAQGRLVVASQVKAILKAEGVDRSPDPAGHAGFYLWGHVPEPYTLYRGIRSVPAGTSLTIGEGGGIREQRYCGIPQLMATAAGDGTPDTRDRVEILKEALRDAVSAHLVSDVPVGIFLSSGLDSTMIAALAAEAGGRLHSVTLGFEEYRGKPEDETPLAVRVAARLGLKHDTVWVSREEFLEDRERVLSEMDQPSIDGVNSWFVSKAAAAVGMKVALSGLGGDELFGGYPSFRQIPRIVRMLKPLETAPAVGRAVRRMSSPLFARVSSPKYASVAEYGFTWGGAYLLRRALFMPWELGKVMDPDMALEGLAELDTIHRLNETGASASTPFAKVSALESCWYMRNQLLRDADWASMAHSLEVRVPLVDITLTRKVFALSNGGDSIGKRQAIEAATPELAPILLGRGKTGFTVPVRSWFLGSEGAVDGRGLRGWANYVYAAQYRTPGGRGDKPARTASRRNLRIAMLLTDGYGARGGIAQYDRDFIEALCTHPRCGGVTAFPRHAPDPVGTLPALLDYRLDSVGGKVRYVRSVVSYLARMAGTNLIVCGHINLLPLAWALKKRFGAPILLLIYGVDAWQPVGGLPVRKALRQVDVVASISRITLDRFLSWSGIDPRRCRLLPNAIHLERYGLAPKNRSLLMKYGLENRRVLMTLGRIVSTERGKGFDEVLEVLPRLLPRFPDLAYLVVGEGDGLERLKRKAAVLGVADRVVFAGFISEEEKADHYRLADVYVMPSRGEGFGFVFLEAMACGVPVVASSIDGSREAVREGDLGTLVDPDAQEAIAAAIAGAIAQAHGIPPGLEYFSVNNFDARCHGIVDDVATIGIVP